MNNEKFEQLRLIFLPRFWDKEREIMIYPELKHIHEQICFKEEYLNGFYDEYIINYNDIQLSDILFNDNYIMMKPTSLKDKNGKLIYFGDIIHIAGEGYIVIDEKTSWELQERIYNGTYEDVEYIIGNIHENKE